VRVPTALWFSSVRPGATGSESDLCVMRVPRVLLCEGRSQRTAQVCEAVAMQCEGRGL
jgi:hypothetical protein